MENYEQTSSISKSDIDTLDKVVAEILDKTPKVSEMPLRDTTWIDVSASKIDLNSLY